MLNKRNTLTTIYLSTLTVVYGTGIEQGFQDASAVARGNANVATADKASAVHYNPAGLVWAESIQSQWNILGSHLKIKHQSGNSFKHSENIPTGSYFFNYPRLYNNKLALGIGMTIPHGLGVDYGDQYPLRDIATNAYLAHLVISPAISYKITDKLSLGMTINYAYDDYEAEQGIFTPGDAFKFQGKGNGWGYSIGALYKATDKLTLGINYKSSIKTNLNGDFTTRTVLPVASTTVEPSSTNIDYPQQLIIGAAYQFNSTWRAEVNLQWTDWSSFDEAVISKSSGNIVIPQNYKDTFLINFGATRRINETTKFQFGYMYSSLANPGTTYSPIVTSGELHSVTAGIDKTLNQHWDISLATVLYLNKSRQITGSPSSPIVGNSSDGKWSSKGITFLVGATYSF